MTNGHVPSRAVAVQSSDRSGLWHEGAARACSWDGCDPAHKMCRQRRTTACSLPCRHPCLHAVCPSIQLCKAARLGQGLCGTSRPPRTSTTACPLAGMGMPCSQPGGFGGAFTVASGTSGVKPGKGQRWERSPDPGGAAKRCMHLHTDAHTAWMEISRAPATHRVTPARQGRLGAACLRTPNFRASPNQAGTDQPEGFCAHRQSSSRRTRVLLAATVAPGGDAEDGRRSRTPALPQAYLAPPSHPSQAFPREQAERWPHLLPRPCLPRPQLDVPGYQFVTTCRQSQGVSPGETGGPGPSAPKGTSGPQPVLPSPAR